MLRLRSSTLQPERIDIHAKSNGAEGFQLGIQACWVQRLFVERIVEPNGEDCHDKAAGFSLFGSKSWALLACGLHAPASSMAPRSCRKAATQGLERIHAFQRLFQWNPLAATDFCALSPTSVQHSLKCLQLLLNQHQTHRNSARWCVESFI